LKSPGKVTIILNPAASGGDGARIRPTLESELKRRAICYTLFQTEGPGHALHLAREAGMEGTDFILCVGGDGTVHEVANGVLGVFESPPPLAVVPVGTGNDFHRMLGSSKDPGTALDGVLNGEVRHFDVGRVRHGGKEAFFVNLLGLGVDVEVLRKRAAFPRLRGLPQYLAALVSALARFRPVSVKLGFSLNGEEDGGDTVEQRTILMAVTVGPSVGGGFLLNPDASPYDGLLDLFLVESLGMFKIARYIPKVIRGTHQGVPELLQRRVARVTVEQSDEGPFFFEMDGEVMPDPVDRLEVEVCPRILPVLVPGRSP
jgi:YegS/Rv2252/BmrU family lipid kinase